MKIFHLNSLFRSELTAELSTRCLGLSRGVATPSILCHKEPAGHPKSPSRGYGTQKATLFRGIRIPCTERSYYSRPYASSEHSSTSSEQSWNYITAFSTLAFPILMRACHGKVPKPASVPSMTLLLALGRIPHLGSLRTRGSVLYPSLYWSF